MALDDDGARPKLIETVFVARGAEERAVRRGVKRAGSTARIVTHGIGPLAAAAAADAALGEGAFGTALATGLCGLLSPSFLVGDAIVYREIVRDGAPPIALDVALGNVVARNVRGSQTGVRAVQSETILTTALVKQTAAAHFRAQAVDMESYALAERLGRAGVSVAVMRVGSDASHDDLPELDRGLDGSGGIDGFAMALAMLRAPGASVRLIRSGTAALAALERATCAALTG